MFSSRRLLSSVLSRNGAALLGTLLGFGVISFILGRDSAQSSTGTFPGSLFALPSRDYLFLLLLLVDSILFAYFYFRFVSDISDLEECLRAYGRGYFSRVPAQPRTLELRGLSETSLSLRDRISRQLKTLDDRQREQSLTLKSIRQGILVLDSQKRIVDLNPAASRLLSIDDEMILGKEVRALGDLGKSLSDFCGVAHSHEFEVHDSDSAPRWLRATTAPIRGERRSLRGTIVELSDITDFKRFERTRQDFVANVSHELKTPITSIQGYVDTLLDGSIHEDSVRDSFLQIISRQANRLSSIVGELLSLARLETEQALDPETLSDTFLYDVLSSAQEACHASAEARSIRVHILCEKSLQSRLNRWLIEQAVINLLDNAIKYGNPGGIIRLVTHVESRRLVISVVDEGPGIPPQHLPRLFERFYRVDKARSRKAGGSGLGLSIVKHIAAVHGGKVLVESETGKGSTFSMVLPYSPRTIEHSTEALPLEKSSTRGWTRKEVHSVSPADGERQLASAKQPSVCPPTVR